MKILILLAIVVLYIPGIAQTSIDTNDIRSINKKLENLIRKQESKIFKVGLSVGMRTFIKQEKDSRAIASITPDSNVSIDHGDMMAVVLSSSFTAFPFTLSDNRFLKSFGFTVNINLLEFTDNQIGSVFNKPIDGGLGFAYAFGEDKNFAVAITYERIAIRRPTKFVLSKEGEKIVENGRAVTSLDSSDNRYYMDSGLNGCSIKFIFHFN